MPNLKESELIAEIERLRTLLAKVMSEAGVPEKYYNDDMVTLVDDDGVFEVVPFRVAVLCSQYGLTWEVFYCNDHNQWIDEVGNSFPYDWGGVTCPKCRGEEDE